MKFLLVGVLLTSTASYAENVLELELAIPAQPLSYSLKEIAEVFELKIAFFADEAVDATAVPLIGHYSAPEAFKTVLEGTGLEYQYVNISSVVVSVPSQAAEKSPAKLSGIRKKDMEKSTSNTWLGRVFALVTSGLLASGAGAQGDDGNDSASGASSNGKREIEEIIVTVQKRSQSLQEVPLAITAFTGDSIKGLHIKEFTDIFLYTPGLVGAPNYAWAERTAIRGLGAGAFSFGFDPHVGVFVDGVHQGRNGVQSTSMFDVERVEVVKGPVGALYGRSTIAGAISIINNAPAEEFEGSVDIGFGERNQYASTAVVNVPLADNLFFRGGVHSESEDGFHKNVTTGKDIGDSESNALRAALRYAKDRLDATLSVNYEDRTDAPNIYQVTRSAADTTYFGLPVTDYILDPSIDAASIGPFGDNYDVATDLDPEHTIQSLGITATINYDFNDKLSVKSITSYRDIDVDYTEDFDGNAIPDLTYFGPFIQNIENDFFQQEFQFTYFPTNGLTVILGASYYDEDMYGYIGSDWSETLNFFSSPTTLIQSEFGETDGTYEGWSVFADVTIPVTDDLEVILGARYSYDEKELSQFVPSPSNLELFPGNNEFAIPYNWPAAASSPVTSKDDWDDTTLRASLNYRMNDDINVYLSWAEGYKAGAIDSLSFEAENEIPAYSGADVSDPAINGRPAVADPESSDSYELGIKAQLFEQRLQVNTALFYYEFEDQQQLVSQGAAFIIENVGKVEGSGAEVEIRFLPNGYWDLSVNAAYLDTEITEDDISPENVGQSTSRAPQWTAAANATYTFPVRGGEAFVNASYSYQDEMLTGSSTVPSYNLVNMRIGYDSNDDWGLSLYAQNLTDEYYYFQSIEASGFGNSLLDLRANFGQPRTFGAEAYFRF